MTIAQAYLSEFEQEAQTTRRFLERLPEDKLTWRPHERSMTAGQLALHIATAPGGVAELGSQDTAPAPDFGRPNPQPKNVREVLEALEESVAKVKRILPQLDDASMRRTWSATHNGKPVLSMPRVAFFRNILLNHWIQHRGQFSVYLRLMGQKVPASYGPSADEMPAFLEQQQTA